MNNSKLVDYTKKTSNFTSRKNSISVITPHCCVGQLSVETIGALWTPSSKASSNYGIGSDGRIGLYVDECNRSWCSSSSTNDHKAVTIECASGLTSPYEMNDKVWNSLIDLCTDICQRNGKTKLLWIDNKEKALAYVPKEYEMIITVHRWFANKECPGNWLYSRLGCLSEEVNKRLNEPTRLFRVQVGAFRFKENAELLKEKLIKNGYDAYIV